MHQGLCALTGRRVGQAFELAGAAVRRKWPLAKAGRGERVERQSAVHSREPVGSKKEVASGEQRNPKTPGFPGRDVPHLRRSAFYLPRTQRLRAGLTYAAPTALQKRESRLEALRNSGQDGGTNGGRGKTRAAG